MRTSLQGPFNICKLDFLCILLDHQVLEKQVLALYIANQFNKPVRLSVVTMNCRIKIYLGSIIWDLQRKKLSIIISTPFIRRNKKSNRSGSHGQLIEAVKNGHTVIYDEFSRSRPETNNIFLALLRGKSSPYLRERKRIIYKMSS